MAKDVSVNIEHITRVEGHGNIIVNAKNGDIKKIEWQIPEAPRFFEAIVREKPYYLLSHITSRICGICSIGHSLASLKATEAAMGVNISDQTALLRRLALHGENLQSHILHIGYLVAPDLLGVGSVFPLIKTHTDAVKKIVGLHRLANEMSDMVCGRTTHPTTMMVGGFTQVPTAQQLETIKRRLIDAVKPTKEVANIVLKNANKLPNFTRETEYIGLISDKEYALYDGIIGSTDTGEYSIKDYLSITNEFVVPHSTAKHAKHNRDSYMVGALARFNLNFDKLSPIAKDIAKMFSLKPINYNPFMNNVAQIVEIAHSIEDSIGLIDQLLKKGIKEERPDVKIKAGRGIGAVEVPRGLLFHDYTIDDKGLCTKANCIIPTNQNHRNIQKDMEEFVPKIIKKPQKEIELSMEMLVRAYDPCISCSTHYLNVKFI
ncbi:MAG: Ni/Fe hydrogenase subunit alpha [Thermoplasmatales archaeon]|nr:MAG: Ni/Fe hydrogenase subunit alpha [Thermoplasmatales archaeon]